MKRAGEFAFFVCVLFLLAGCLRVAKIVPDRASLEDVIDLRDPTYGTLGTEGVVYFGDVEAPLVLSWQPQDVFVQVPDGLTGEVPVHLEILGVKSNVTTLLILQSDPNIRLLCFGDSMIYGGVPEDLQVVLDNDPYISELGAVVINQGKSAELLSRETTWTRWSNALTFHGPTMAILLEATNDVSDKANVPLESIQDSLIGMLDEAMVKGVDMILCTLLPRVGECGDVESPTTEEYNAWLSSVADGQGIPLVDLYDEFVSTPGWELELFDTDDCLHPNENGKSMIAELLAGKIEEVYPPPGS